MFKFKVLLIAVLIIIGINFLFAYQVPRETVIAEFDGGKILYGYIEDRIAKIPPMYQTKYKTEDGMKSLLDMMCTEEVFYFEAISLGLDTTDNFVEHSEMQVKSLLFNEFKKDLLNENVKPTLEQKEAFFVEHSEDFYAGRVYEEVAADVENRLKSQMDEEYVNEHYSKLKQDYLIVINEDVLSQIDLENLENNESILDSKLYASTEPRIERTVKYLLSLHPELPPQQRELLKQPEKLYEYIDDMVRTWSFAFEAEEKGYAERPELQETIDQIRKNVLLRSVYNILVVDAVEITDESMYEYYETNIESYSSKATRKIQVFTFEDEKQAKNILKKSKKAVKKNKEEDVDLLISENCTYTNNRGIIGNIYNNGIIPGFGKDEKLADLIWSEQVLEIKNEFSDIFQNNKDEFMYFRLLEDNPAQAQPYEEVAEKIRSKLNKDLTRKKFDEVTSDLKSKYNVVTYDDRMFVVLTAEEYFNFAEEAQKKRRYEDAIYYYDKVIKNHKNQTDDYKALFMKAFLYAEEIKQPDLAKELFNQLINEYPESDLHESARFMILELEGKSNIIESFESEE